MVYNCVSFSLAFGISSVLLATPDAGVTSETCVWAMQGNPNTYFRNTVLTSYPTHSFGHLYMLNTSVQWVNGWVFLTDFYSLRKDVEATSLRVEEIRASAGLEQLGEELAKLETQTASDSFWDDRTSAQQTLVALTDVKDKINLLKEFQSQVWTCSFLIMCYAYLAKRKSLTNNK